jgi:hypothetical protein
MESKRERGRSVSKEFVFKGMTNKKQEFLGKEFINIFSFKRFLPYTGTCALRIV